MRELYQEGAARATSDGAIAVLQGRSVGGSTTVNWTSSFRTPEPTLKHWAAEHEVVGPRRRGHEALVREDGKAPGRRAVGGAERQQQRAASAAATSSAGRRTSIPRNVKGCWNSGYCGFGCPVNAKQSMLVSTIPEALRNGATLVHRLRVRQLQHADGKITRRRRRGAARRRPHAQRRP